MLRNKVPYPEIDDANFKGALGTFQQWLALKIRVHYEISILLLLMSSCKMQALLS